MEKSDKYGLEYWNNKWKKNPIIYSGRVLMSDSYEKKIHIDVKSFIKKNDAILLDLISKASLNKETANATAWEIQKFVCAFLRYKYDDIKEKPSEFWQYPYESVHLSAGDCEDGAILIASLMINAGIPSWRVKVCVGYVLADPMFNPSDSELGGHCYSIFLANREDSERGLEWVILDWCYLQDPDLPVEEKPFARDGGQESAYKDIWFTFNDKYSWSPESFEIELERISKIKKEEALKSLEHKRS